MNYAVFKRKLTSATKKAAVFLGVMIPLLGQPAAGYAATDIANGATPTSSTSLFPATVTLSTDKGEVGTHIRFTISGLMPNQNVQMNWDTKTGSYKIDGVYTFVSPIYENQKEILLSGTSDAKGVWTGDFTIPKGFGGNHTLFFTQNNKEMAQTNIYVAPSFHVFPTSGPVGTPITIQAEGIGPSTIDSNWQVTYDNKLTGLISAVSTNGTAEATIRAAGPIGLHTLTVWHGWMGMPYVNYTEAPDAYLPVPTFSFTVTADQPIRSFVEKTPDSAANGGLDMPALKFQNGVSVTLDKASGTVGQSITLTAAGLPANKQVDLLWNTMSGSRISGQGFQEEQSSLGKPITDANGKLQYTFPIPDDLGGVPHRIDISVNGTIFGQAYLRILPSITSVTPVSGPAGTTISVKIKGVGWTEFDNTYYITYDNAYVGYVCGFNSRGTVAFTLTASGDPGYHLIDLYPGIYRGQKPLPNIYNAPQLTYGQDHPGDAIPAIRLGFEITK